MESFYVFLEEFEKELTCSICEKIFTDPVTLPCLHSFCSECMEQLCENNTNVSCAYPGCRSPFDVPDGDVSKLCSSFYLKVLLKLIQVIGTKARWEGQEMQCINCERATNLVAICQQCNGLTCLECTNAHNILKRVSKDHEVIMLNEMNRDNVEDFMKNLVFCEEESHENNGLEYFCFEETCKKYICLKCAVGDHKSHNFPSVDDASEKVKQNIKQNMKRIDNLKQGYEEELSFSKQNISRIQSEVELAKKQVHDAVEVVIQKARDHEEAMSKALDEIVTKQQEANEGEQSDINTGINHLSEFNIHCQSLIDRNRKYEVIDVQDILKDKCEVALQKSSILSSKPIQRNVRLRYVCQIPEVENMGKIVENLPDSSNCTIESLNDVRCGFENQFEIVTKTSEGELCDTNIEYIYVEIKDPDGKEVQSKVFGKQKGKFSVSYRADRPGTCTIVVRIAGEMVKNSPRNVNTLDVKSDFKYVKWFGGEGEGEGKFIHPWSVALSEDGEIAIGDRDRDCIQIFDTEGEYIREIKCRENQESGKFQPYSVTFFEDKLIVTGFSAGNGEILMIDLKSSNVRTIYRSEERVTLRGMCVTDENNIAVCYYGNEQHGINSGIKLFDKEGTFLREFYSPEKDRKPWGVAYGNRKYFVSYYDESCVRVFDSNGGFLHKFGEQGQDCGQFDKVGGLALYNPDLVAVCDHCNDRVQLLTEEGKFVKSFGKELGGPSDLAVTSDGRVFVLNFGSKQVQLWC